MDDTLSRNPDVDEEAAFLQGATKNKRTPTPLSKSQISIALLMQICEPLTSQSIYPYINQLVSELDITGGDERKVGYYAGLIESLFFATEALTVLQWSRTSDIIGRKPVLLIGLTGTMISMLAFGLSRTFWALVVSRCLTGLLNGNIGVMKSLMGDLTDSTNRAEGFSLLPVVWSLGATFGPLLGGTFARPAERFPGLFNRQFWIDYPYFLPCLVTASFVAFTLIISALFLKETVHKKPIEKSTFKSYGSIEPPTRAEHSRSSSNGSSMSRSKEDPVPLRELFTFPVVISVCNYVLLAFLNICFNALFPLFLAMPQDIGGLGLPPSAIGYIMGAYGAATGIFQFFYFARIIHWLGERQVFINGILAFIPMFVLPPFINLAARQTGMSALVWTLIAVILTSGILMDMSFGAIFMFVTASAPNKRSLGATNGLSQTSVSIARAIGPALATSMFSLSVQKNLLGGYAVYVFMVFLTLVATFVGTRLPKDVWQEEEEEE